MKKQKEKYSVEEIQKIWDSKVFELNFIKEYKQGINNATPEDLINWMFKNPKKIKIVLEKKK